jgi:hypothetical protein
LTPPRRAALYVPANAVHAGKATPSNGALCFTAKNSSLGLPGIEASRLV